MDDFGLTQTVAPTAEPVTLAEAKNHLRVDDSDDDRLITRSIVAARRYAEQQTGRQFITATWRLRLPEFPSEIILPRPPLDKVSHVKYIDTNGDEQTLAEATYQVSADREPARIWLAYGESWPSTQARHEAVAVTYTAGYGASASDVPEEARQAILLLVAHMYRYREPVISGGAVMQVPLTVRALLRCLSPGWMW